MPHKNKSEILLSPERNRKSDEIEKESAISEDGNAPKQIERRDDRVLEDALHKIHDAPQKAILCLGDITGLSRPDRGSDEYDRGKKYRDEIKKQFGEEVVVVSSTDAYNAGEAGKEALRVAMADSANHDKKIVFDGPLPILEQLNKVWGEGGELMKKIAGEDGSAEAFKQWLQKGGVMEDEKLGEPKTHEIQEKLREVFANIKTYLHDTLHDRPLVLAFKIKDHNPALLSLMTYASYKDLTYEAFLGVESQLHELNDVPVYFTFSAEGIRTSIKERSKLRAS